LIVTLCGKTFPAGTVFELLLAVENQRSRSWDRPNEFIPDRWLQLEHKHPYLYIPFSAGPRNCIGQKFAIQEALILFAVLIRKFSVKAVGEKTCRAQLSPALTAEDFQIAFTIRK